VVKLIQVGMLPDPISGDSGFPARPSAARQTHQDAPGFKQKEELV
jgi:hypothetical protein